VTVRHAVGVDVGGTKCLAVVVEIDDATGRLGVVAEHRVDTPATGTADVVAAVAGLIRDLAVPGSVAPGAVAPGAAGRVAVGIGLPGLVDRAGTLWAAPNLRIDGPMTIGPLLADELGRDLGVDLDVVVDNDATCATVAEWQMGAGRHDGVPVDDLVVVTLGTGIGGGVVAGGRLQRGHNGFAGEIGHMVVDPAGPVCPCGRRGCWERYSSGSGLAHLAGGRRGEDVVAAARAGDAEALAVIAEFGRWTGIGLANLTNLLDPDLLVIAGGLVSSADVLAPAIDAGFAEALYAPDRRPHPGLRMAELGEPSGAIGAALLAAGI
jgi:glucokinase